MAAEPENLSLASSLLSAVVPRLRVGARENDAQVHGPAALHGGTVVCLCDAQGIVRQITPNAAEVLGEACERAAEFRLSLGSVLQPENPDDVDNMLREMLSIGDRETYTADLLTRAPTGSPRWLEIWCRNLLQNAAVSSLLIEVRDVTLGRIDDKLRALLSAGMQHLPESVMVTDTAGVIRFVNPAFERSTGYAAHEAIGRTPALLKSGQHRPDHYEQLWRTVSAGQVWEGELCNRRKDGELYNEQVIVAPIHDGHGVISHFLSAARDVSVQKRASDLVEHQAYYDEDTGMLRPRLLHERGKSLLALARRPGRSAALLHITLESLPTNAEPENRTAALRIVAERLRVALRESDSVARLTDRNEFLVLLGEVADEDAAARVVRRLRESLGRSLEVSGLTITPRVIVGVALCPQDATTYDDLIALAEQALDRARVGNSPVEFFKPQLTELINERLLLEDDFGWAWERKQLVLHYQPVVELGPGSPTGARALAGLQALARWPHLERGIIAPAQFIPLVERTGRLVALDRWAIAAAVNQAANWSGWDGWVSINLSERSLHDAGLVHYISSCLQQHGINPARVVVEITESIAMHDIAISEHVLLELKDAGVLIGLDEFGMGRSSLAHLNHLPVDLLKLDAGLIREIGSDPKCEQTIDLMITIARSMGAKVVAEGVEYESQLDWLRKAGCDYAQGVLLGQPQPPEAVEPGKWGEIPDLGQSG